jgi:hypothetical protein
LGINQAFRGVEKQKARSGGLRASWAVRVAWAQPIVNKKLEKRKL